MDRQRSIRLFAALVAVGGFLSLSGVYASQTLSRITLLDSVWFYALTGTLQLGGGVGLLWTIVRTDGASE
ncbi:hypothetical protein ACFQL1_09505 [Halomicroarcula sp. GCM10025709]|uniref:hypothetical protein n=1 Tax=Haloarcula TaxID=2237 RepID=UPI0024C35AFE|nr:hypothetical protein [Halomicroarcula sp. YJ-61-S]